MKFQAKVWCPQSCETSIKFHWEIRCCVCTWKPHNLQRETTNYLKTMQQITWKPLPETPDLSNIKNMPSKVYYSSCPLTSTIITVKQSPLNNYTAYNSPVGMYGNNIIGNARASFPERFLAQFKPLKNLRLPVAPTKLFFALPEQRHPPTRPPRWRFFEAKRRSQTATIWSLTEIARWSFLIRRKHENFQAFMLS